MRRIPRGRRARSGHARAAMLAYLTVVLILACLLAVAILGWVARAV